MENLAKLLTAIASLAWPLVAAVLLFALFNPLRKLVESAMGRKFTIKVAGNELTMEEASEQQRVIVADLQSKLADLERRLNANAEAKVINVVAPGAVNKRILWVDDTPKNNSYLVASIEERGARVDIALSTDDGIRKFKQSAYDIVVTDMARPESDRAGLDLTRQIKAMNPDTPVYIFCGAWAARNLVGEALGAGVALITSSGTTLLSRLPLARES